jgi:hypothetical protein
MPRWADSEDELPDELRLWLRGGGAALGSTSEVAELRQRLAALLGPAVGLGGGEPPSGDSSSGDPSSGASSSGASPEGTPNAAERSTATGARATDAPAGLEPAPAPHEPVLSSPGTGAPPAAQAAAIGHRLGRWGWVALGGVGIAVGVWVFGGRPPAPDAAPSVPVLAVAPPVPSPPEAETGPSSSNLEPAPRAAQPPSLAPQRPPEASSAAPARRGARSRPSRPPSLGEAALLERARNALNVSPATALALTRDHDRRFPRGVLAQESEVIAIEALKRLGRDAAAARRTAEFERRDRGSVHKQRLEGAGGAPR